MDSIGQPERATQNRIIALFRDELRYRHLGDWTDRHGNSNIEEGLLSAWLTNRGYTPAQIAIALHKLRTEADNPNRTLYGNNQAVYKLLRYGVPVKTEAGKVTETVHLIDWNLPEKNEFAIAEEVTLKGNQERRPDGVIYVNGLAIGTLELKNSRVSIGDGIRQSLSNQQPEFNAWFYSTVQFVFAGSDSEGLKYGTTGTPETYFLQWKEDEADDSRFKLDKYLLKLCEKHRLIELLHDFVLFDGGIKKLPRVHQYFAIAAAQRHVRRRQGGIIWHTQGSGKSIVMVLLARWILENLPKARVLIITDRDELDSQIEGVFTEAGETIYRTSSGRDLMSQLGQAKPRLLCSLVHKFGHRDIDDFDAFITDLEGQPSQTVGEVFVFVDECHRTQSGKLNRVMKAMMPNAVFIGFTGTPLLKKDKATSLEVFGGYIHTYKFSEAVADAVVLDLIYEARDIDQRLGSKDKIDAWFAAKTKGLNDWQKEELKRQWGTMQRVLSSRSRMDRVVNDILFDFSVKPRLSSERGNAILVASSIYEACKYFTLFQQTPLKGKCAVVTSYNPQAQDLTREETGANTETDRQFIYSTYTELLKAVDAKPGLTKTATYEERAKALFTREPAGMKLLMVVDKLLTGFDAPPCTYSTSTSPCRTTHCSRPSAAPTGSTATTSHSATSSTIRTSSRRWRTPSRSTPPSWTTARAGRTPRSYCRTGSRRARNAWTTRSKPWSCCPSRCSRPGASWSTSTTSAATPRSRPISMSGSRSGPRSRKIIKEHLTDPAFYATMSAQLQEIIELRKAQAIAYEEYLQRIAELAQRVAAGQPQDSPAALDTPGKRALYNNLMPSGRGPAAGTSIGEEPGVYNGCGGSVLDLALKIDEVVRAVRPDGWRGVQARELVIKRALRALYDVLQDAAEVERLFLIIKAQTEYIVAHELTHLLERHHNERFKTLLDARMPQWPQYRDLLNRLPLAHEEWGY